VSNIVLFDALWTLAVLGAGKPWWWAAPVLIVASAAAQLRRSPAPGAEALLIVVGAIAGVALDVAANALGMFRHAFASQAQFIVVFTSLWVNFGTTLRPSLRWLWRRPALGALLGGAFGPLAYWTAARIGAIEPTEPSWRAFVWCGVQYALALPLWCAAASFAFRSVPRSDRPRSSNASPPLPDTPVSPGSPAAPVRGSMARRGRHCVPDTPPSPQRSPDRRTGPPLS
jgi:hypothetical protein